VANAPEEKKAEKAEQAEKKPARQPRQARSGSGQQPRGRGKAAPAAKAPAEKVTPRILERYRADVKPVLIREFGYTNPMQAPELKKVVVNIGLGEALTSTGALSAAMNDLSIITGQKAKENRAKKSIAAFKLREGQPIGASVTLRGARMWQFFDRLVNIALPRVRDFRGSPREAFDSRGNYSLGMTDQAVFPEIDYNQIDRLRGLQIVMVTSARTDEEGRRLLELLGMPFVKPETAVAAAS
jgi:large subunit ribosomal protein L5